ncbi:hypothetical protein B0H13DRAFT_2544001 [Mycena leptocephala]|nr:hypothetical protein B0H13DRAFT_2544001 [Mycena leptocephala]
MRPNFPPLPDTQVSRRDEPFLVPTSPGSFAAHHTHRDLSHALGPWRRLPVYFAPGMAPASVRPLTGPCLCGGLPAHIQYFAVGIGGVDIDIYPRSTHAGAVDSPVSAAGVAVLALLLAPQSYHPLAPALNQHYRVICAGHQDCPRCLPMPSLLIHGSEYRQGRNGGVGEVRKELSVSAVSSRDISCVWCWRRGRGGTGSTRSLCLRPRRSLPPLTPPPLHPLPLQPLLRYPLSGPSPTTCSRDADVLMEPIRDSDA